MPDRNAALPGDVRLFLREADRRIDRFRIEHHIPGFVPSDFARAYDVLRSVAEADLAAGTRFCEWGSGFGVVTCLAAMLDFDACGIEVEASLVDAARQLAEDYDLPAEFLRGSFIPAGCDVRLDPGEGFVWLTTEADDPEDAPDLGPDDFDVIFVYPWPDEEPVVEDLFETHARPGTLLLSYHGGDDFLLRRKKAGRKRRGGQ